MKLGELAYLIKGRSFILSFLFSGNLLFKGIWRRHEGNHGNISPKKRHETFQLSE